MYHEWGHALHSLFSRTIFQHLSGTRGAVDFVEVPSHLFEYFARSPNIIQQWARHHRTGQKPPVLLLEEALLSRNPFGAVETQTQILLSAADQHIFGPGLGDVQGLAPTDIYQKARLDVVQIQQKLTDLPVEKQNPAINMALHSHFVNYGGGYYSYLFAKMYAAQVRTLTHSRTLAYSLIYVLTHSITLTYSLTYSLTHSLTYLLAHSLTHSLTHSPTYPLTYSLT